MLQRHTYVQTKFMYPSQACSQLNLEMAYRALLFKCYLILYYVGRCGMCHTFFLIFLWSLELADLSIFHFKLMHKTYKGKKICIHITAILYCSGYFGRANNFLGYQKSA